MNRHWKTQNNVLLTNIKLYLNKLKACETQKVFLVCETLFSCSTSNQFIYIDFQMYFSQLNKQYPPFRIKYWIIVPGSILGGTFEDVTTLYKVYSITWMPPISIIQTSPKEDQGLFHSWTKAWTKEKLIAVQHLKTNVWDANYFNISCQSK